MATSPIYNWPEPDNTDLVKNGALAIRTLGNAIDTTMATMVPKTIVDAKGDLIAGTAADTAARLAVGNNGETIVADSSTATGLSYQANWAAGKNKVINGNFNIWQRGTSFTATAYGTRYADRFLGGTDGSGITRTVSQQSFTVGAAPVAGYESQYFLRVNQSVAGTGSGFNVLDTQIEDVRTFAGQTVTMSFWMKADSARTITGGIVQEFGSGGSGGVNTSLGSFNVTTSWTRFTSTVTLPSISGKTIGTSNLLLIRFNLPLNAVFTIDTWGWQLEAGSVATAFQTATGTIQGELAACQRYYWRTTASNSATYSTVGNAYSTTQAVIQTRLPVTMRIAPYAVDFTTLQIYSLSNSGQTAVTGLAVNAVSVDNVEVIATVASGLTANNIVNLRYNGSGSYLGFSAEL